MRPFTILSSLALLSLVSARQLVPDTAPVVKRAPELAPRLVGSFKFDGMRKRDPQAPGKVEIGTSNPSPAPEDLVSGPTDSTPMAGTANGDLVNIKKTRRDAPPIVDKRRSLEELIKRQTPPKVDIGTSNPAPPAGALNDADVAAPAAGDGDGSITNIRDRLFRRSPHPELQLHELNLVSHNVATRGLADGSIVVIGKY